jgi:hypothetical protein
MTRREQILANRKSLARLHVLECNQWIIGESTLKKGGSRSGPTGSPQSNRKSLGCLRGLHKHTVEHGNKKFKNIAQYAYLRNKIVRLYLHLQRIRYLL